MTDESTKGGLPTRADPDVCLVAGDLNDGRDPATVPVRGMDVCGHCIAAQGMRSQELTAALQRLSARGTAVVWKDCPKHSDGSIGWAVQSGLPLKASDVQDALGD